MAPRDSPRPPSDAPRRPLRRRWAGAATAATAASAVLLPLLLAFVGRANACTVNIYNSYNVNYTLNAYNGWDASCTDWYESVLMQPGLVFTQLDCIDASACKIKIADSTNSCYGTVLVPCGDGHQLTFYYGPDGQFEYSVSRRRRRRRRRGLLLEVDDEEAERSEEFLTALSLLGGGGGGVAAGAESNSSSSGEGVNDPTNISSSLRGAMGSKQIT